MLQAIACVTAECDQCRERCWDDVECTLHWPTEAVARAYLAGEGWQVSGPRLLCARCAVSAVCQAQGHEFTSWRGCCCVSRIAANRVEPDGVCGWQWRSCARCEDVEDRTAPVTAAGVPPVAGAGVGVT